VTINALGFYFMPALTLGASIALLTLQARALRRHGHRSFLLLVLSTTCGLLYLVGLYVLTYLAAHGDPLPDSAPAVWPYIATILETGQVVLGLWGTASLFSSYGELASAASSQAPPNNRWRGP
jgi:predicted PurR-regulated permease PerM